MKKTGIHDRFDFYDYGHALAILTQEFPEEWADIMAALEHQKNPPNNRRAF